MLSQAPQSSGSSPHTAVILFQFESAAISLLACLTEVPFVGTFVVFQFLSFKTLTEVLRAPVLPDTKALALGRVLLNSSSLIQNGCRKVGPWTARRLGDKRGLLWHIKN